MPIAFSGTQKPWFYFCEDFLAFYDLKLRKGAGGYYLPPKIVHAQVELIDDLMVNRLGKPLGFDPTMVTLDPAAEMGMYLLGVAEQTVSSAIARAGLRAKWAAIDVSRESPGLRELYI